MLSLVGKTTGYTQGSIAPHYPNTTYEFTSKSYYLSSLKLIPVKWEGWRVKVNLGGIGESPLSLGHHNLCSIGQFRWFLKTWQIFHRKSFASHCNRNQGELSFLSDFQESFHLQKGLKTHTDLSISNNKIIKRSFFGLLTTYAQLSFSNALMSFSSSEKFNPLRLLNCWIWIWKRGRTCWATLSIKLVLQYWHSWPSCFEFRLLHLCSDWRRL